MAQSDWLIDLSQRLYETAVKLYPAPFRADYEAEIIWLFNRMCQDAFAQAGYPALAAVWLRTISDFAFSLCEQHWQTWRSDTMENDTKLLRLIASINVSVIGLLAILALGWGIFALGFHRNGLLARPFTTVHWSHPLDSEVPEFTVYRATADEETVCSAVPGEAYTAVPRSNIQSGQSGVRPTPSSPDIPQLSWHTLKDNYQMNRGDIFCYKIELITGAGSVEKLIPNKIGASFYDWNMIAFGFVSLIMGLGLVILARQTLRLAGRIAEPVTAT